VSYLRWQDAAAWMACAGRPALEESEGELAPEVTRLSQAARAALDARRSALEGATTVEILPLQSLEVGAITGERGALAWGSLVLAEYQDHSALEVYPPDPILGLAALIKYSILHQITATNVGAPEELYAFGAQVTEAAQLSLNLRASITALEHLVPGDYCRSCRAMYRCPALTEEVHRDVFGPVQSPHDPDAVALQPNLVELDLAYLRNKLPLIEAWLNEVKARTGGGEKPAPTVRRRRKSKRQSIKVPKP
jgi:Protein of unknown function (DUF2800)